jgi:hypothetical protein
MRAVAILLALSACFPHDAHKQTLAKYAEGAALVTGIAMQYAVNSQADCDADKVTGAGAGGSCQLTGAVLGDVGVGLILAGLVGFVVTVSTAEDAAPQPAIADQRPPLATKAPALH